MSLDSIWLMWHNVQLHLAIFYPTCTKFLRATLLYIVHIIIPTIVHALSCQKGFLVHRSSSPEKFNYRANTYYELILEAIKLLCITAGSSQSVSLFQFIETVAIKIPSKWRRVGVAFGLSQSQIDAIEKQRLADPLGCHSDVFSLWQQLSIHQQPVSWTALVTVLCSQSVGEEHLAEFIQQTFVGNDEYCQPTCQLMIVHTLLFSQQTSWFLLLSCCWTVIHTLHWSVRRN